MPDDNAEPDRYELRPDGGVNLWMTGKRIKLRHPRLREYRKLVSAFYDTADQLADIGNADVEWVSALIEERGDRLHFTPDDLVQERKRTRAFQDSLIDAWVKWGREVAVTLASEGEVPEDEDDLPVYFGGQEYAVAIISHWRNVPSPSGAR